MNPTPPFDSAVVKALLLAIVGLVGIVGSFFGIDEAVFNAKATRVVDGLLLLATAGGVFWALYGRLFMRTPPLTQKAVDATIKAGDNKQIPPSSPALIGLIVLGVCLVGLAGCQVTPATAIQEACARDAQYSAIRCAKSIPDTYEVYQESLLRMAEDPTTDPDVLKRIKQADAAMTPVMVAGLDVTQTYNTVRMQLAEGTTTEDQLRIANANLEAWIVGALPKLAALRDALGL
jgi:hypothetical protein